MEKLQSDLAESSSYEDAYKNRLITAMLRKAQVDKKLADIEGDWLEVQEALVRES